MDTFYPRLDGLRAFAVFAVMVFHWVGPQVMGRTLPLGFLGVELFFVLSGYLIGGILLRAQAKNEAAGTSQLFTLRQFVIRRALRIFPAYFAFLLLTAVLLGVPDKQWWWYPTYLGNYRLSVTSEWPAYWSHTWTLAVEEQFYIFAPLVVLCLDRHLVRRAVPAFAALAASFILLTPASTGMTLIPPKAFYGLLVGVVLAMVADGERRGGVGHVVVGFGAAAVSLLAFVFEIHDSRLLAVSAPIAFAALVLWATGSSPLGDFLEWAPLTHIGRLAYGLYLWHLAVETMWTRVGLPVPTNSWVLVACYSVASYGVARLSWTLVEHPVNRWKVRYPYHSLVEAAPVSDAFDQPASRAT